MLNFKQIGHNLQQLRLKMGYDQNEISKLLGINRVTLSNYENGKKDIPLNYLEKLADLYCVEMNDLIENDSEVNELNIACAFRANQTNNIELNEITKVNKVIKNYLKMLRIEDKD